ncbi:DUF4906 domain-containing protein [Parabacteroides sp. BX2]|jgi:hypothetical protein|uniref:DUF4906 domain-containing protein n=1 Tax=Parabacteroides segnis TaxID=2763058 RepID=A0ABR7E1K7_9BACT|nr:MULTISPECIES: DUF4906 domain-containing protein [Parabacteroides]MBC5643640.1 DUF4906 domain-containing protein [Parabacteroides segnis]MCM0713767.1 DUF4906 domain-containing protein [Parabacteroides sp. TA-V-105]
MIHSTKNILYLLLSLLVCTACSDETLVNGQGKVEEGVPVTATLSFSTSDPAKIETKATDIDESNKVSSLAIFIFKKEKDGSYTIDGKKICTTDEINRNSFAVSTTSGSRYIYAVANYKSSLYTITDDFLGKIETIDDLKGLSVTLPKNKDGSSISVLDGVFLMSGCVVAKNNNKIDFDTPCTIAADGTVNGRILLQRIMSSIQFKVMAAKENTTFVADSWQVKNVPQSSYVFERTSAPYEDYESDGFKESKISSVFEKKDTVVNSLNTSSYNFSFLMMENRKTADKEINNYDMREEMNGSESFSNAPANSTYIVLKGTYTGQTDKPIGTDGKPNKNVTAYTTYYIHVGNWNPKYQGTNSDFKIFRNTRYIYTVKVVGVDQIIVEVESDLQEDESWGSDGDIYVASNQVNIFDAHYGTTVISFSKLMIHDLIKRYAANSGKTCDLEMFKDSFQIVGATPRGGFKPSTDKSDLDWVTYKRNTDDGTNFMKYKESKSDEPLDINGFKADLYNAGLNYNGNDSGDSARYTCFIDEYFYTDSDLSLDKFVNQQPRSINILTYYKHNTESSSSSSINMSAYTFVQRPIYTIYDLDRVQNNNVNGWGTESIQETENLPSKEIPDGSGKDYYSRWKNSFDQGRDNMHEWIAKMNYNANYAWNWTWDTFLDYTNNELNSDYKYAQYACLAKNRDLNGDGVIDNDELRWYLPAVNQYTALVIGGDILPEDVRLYRDTDKDVASGHTYVGSTVNANPALSGSDSNTLDYYVLLANEGLSISYRKNNKNSYRCVRNLRDITENITDIVSLSSRYYGDKVYESYSFQNLNPRSKREKVNKALTFGHTSLDEENRLSEAFEVRQNQLYKSDFSAKKANEENPCDEPEKGWRLPNQKELAIFVFHKAENSGQSFSTYFSCTKNAFAANTYCGYLGYNLAIQSMTVWEDSGSQYKYYDSEYGEYVSINIQIRCVRDTDQINK